LFEVRLTVADPDLEGQVFAMPAWIPGSYMIRDYEARQEPLAGGCDES
jgi:predicted metalloprotease with PDZ domain